jgi:hypothetical protein
MKKVFFAIICTFVSAVAAFAQNNGNLQRADPPANAAALVKSLEVKKAPTAAEGQAVVLDPKSATATTAAQPRNEDLPREKRKMVRKAYDAKNNTVLYREVISREELAVRKQERAEVKAAKAAQTKE